MSVDFDTERQPLRCPMIHPTHGVRCEKYWHEDGEHIVHVYWTGGDSLRWSSPVVSGRGSNEKETDDAG